MNQKGNALIIGILIGLLIAGGLFIVYYFGVFKKELNTQSSSKQLTEAIQTNNSQKEISTSSPSSVSATVFKINEIKVGDKIGQMTVQSIEPFDPEISGIPKLSGLSENNFRITFSGQIAITGNYEFMDLTKVGTGDKYVFFTPDSSSATLLPQEAVANKNGYSFIFRNYDRAVKLLNSKGEKGTAKVVIDNLSLVSFPTEINNSADLIQVE